MIVMKFGGSSLADADCVRQVRDLVLANHPRRPLVVVSASGNTTDLLEQLASDAARGDSRRVERRLRKVRGQHLELVSALFDSVFDSVPADLFDSVPADLLSSLEAELEALRARVLGVELLSELSARSRDAIVSVGEGLCARIVAAYLGAEFVDARCVVRTDSRHGRAEPDVEQLSDLAQRRVAPLLAAGSVVITQGFVGADDRGRTTTLGRGGSDYTASLLGAALRAEEIQIWTDVEGVLTSDPRLVPQAFPIAELSFAEAAELAAFGARVLHPATMGPARQADIPVTVRHTRRPEGAFSTIRALVEAPRALTAVASHGPVQVLTARSSRMLHQPGFLARLFEVFARHGVSIDLVATAEVSVSLTVEADVDLAAVADELSAFCRVEHRAERVIVALVGEQLRRTPGLAARCFAALGDINVEMISMGANEINLGLVIEQKYLATALERLHRLFVEPRKTGSPSDAPRSTENRRCA